MELSRDNNRLVVTIDREYRDYTCSSELGTLGTEFQAQRPHTVFVDLSKCEWADPLPLLSLAALLGQLSADCTEIIIDFGSYSGSNGHRIFVKFISNQGFLNILGQPNNAFLWFRDEGETEPTASPVDQLRARLSSLPYDVHYLNADCILAKLLSAQDFKDGAKHVQEEAEALVLEAQQRAIDRVFGNGPIVRDRLLQKLRRLLLETIENAVEHAYAEGPLGFVGIYARIRGQRPEALERARRWNKLISLERIECPTLKRFEPNEQAPWLELFVCDTGRGLLHALDEWRQYADGKLKDGIARAMQSKNPLQAISRLLFHEPLSRSRRTDSSRTTVTGLQYLGRVLSIDGDFARIYTNHEWAGSVHPWAPKQNDGLRTSRGSRDFVGKRPAPGTFYSFSIQPRQSAVSYDGHEWVLADLTARQRLIEILAEAALDSRPANIEFCDRRTANSCDLPTQWDAARIPTELPPVVVLRPPRSVTKRDFGRWLHALAGLPTIPATRPAAVFIIAELTPFQAVTYADFFKQVSVSPSNRIRIILVSEDWSVCCLSKDATNPYRFKPDQKAAHAFLAAGVADTDGSAVILVQLLRDADSQVFWSKVRGLGRPDPVFFHGPVTWGSSVPADGEPKSVMDGYLDLTQALVDPERYEACRRALRRCLALFPHLQPIATDDLIESLVHDAARRLYRPAHVLQADDNKRLAVGSVCVTASTVNRFHDRRDITIEQDLFLFVHPSAAGRTEHRNRIAVLDWQPPRPEQEPVDFRLERIRGTPFIGIDGEQEISVTRFWPKDAEGREFHTSYYGRTPKETYDDFEQLGVLKLGHWVYGSKHDLLTINLSRAFELSCLNNGPLIRWLEQEFSRLFSPKDRGQPAHLLVYPSHVVTDEIISYFKEVPRLVGLLPKAGVVPIKFLGSKTVSPHRVSPLAVQRLKETIAKYNECSAVILDDGCLSGKVLRELTQLLEPGSRRNPYRRATRSQRFAHTRRHHEEIPGT